MPANINPSEESINVGRLSLRFLVTGADSNGSLAAFEMIVPAHQKLPAPPHSHDAYEETIYGVEGNIIWTVDGQRLEVGPSQSICIPRGAVHRFDNEQSQDAKCLCVISPAILGPEYFRETAAALLAAAGSPDPSVMIGIMRRHGLTPALPAAN